MSALKKIGFHQGYLCKEAGILETLGKGVAAPGKALANKLMPDRSINFGALSRPVRPQAEDPNFAAPVADLEAFDRQRKNSATENDLLRIASLGLGKAFPILGLPVAANAVFAGTPGNPSVTTANRVIATSSK